MNELFPIEQVRMDSPMLAWKKKHDVQTYFSPAFQGDKDWMPWCACFGPIDVNADPDSYGYGKTEEEAMRDLAYVHRHGGVKCWNEEQP